MKKIIITGFEAGYANYGTTLMSLAIQRTLQHFGVKAFLLKQLNYEKLPTYSLLKIINPKRKQSDMKLVNTIYSLLYEKDIMGKSFIKRLKFMMFEKKYLNLTRPCFSVEDTEKEVARIGAKAIMAESDCIWHPSHLCDEYVLNIGPAALYRFSYAPSFFVSELSDKQKNVVRKYKDAFKKIDKISVREQSGVELLKEIVNVDASVVVDPVMLLTKKQWTKFMAKPIVKEKYILSYIIEENPYANRCTVEIAKKLNISNIVYIRVGNVDRGYGKESGLNDIILNNRIGPSEFLRLICDAEYICTDSFHALNFSIIFNKQFFAFERQGLYWQPDDRIKYLLNTYHLSNQIVDKSDAITAQYVQEKRIIDYDRVNQLRYENRRNSLDFIKDAVAYIKESNL